ncbi:nucleotidyltransferase domain-containing protein [Sphingomonas radiodurans]|uniref:nucleotidyltransferase domain-containing protein n=1 Tax=Sphingomonas radiodurans TaxID=2890321 RepID=UPI001E5093A3|nr:nucleotidyltransferase family protein [Sphingomonas radiodurans]WBH16853.1 nucleotidyltransferase family protein [Sphingomonas radiodurans]
MTAAIDLVALLVDPSSAEGLDASSWTEVIAAARAEQLIGTLATRLDGLALPVAVAAILVEARATSLEGRRQALWEAEMARRALAGIVEPLILLKGTAFAAAGLDAGQGRSIGDLDILVPQDALAAAETALLAHGWIWVKSDPYDDRYYRQWMHELPPLIHPERDRMIDVHHTILPPTARITPDAARLIANAVSLGAGLAVLAPEDMVVHGAIHLLADGDLSGGLRNLWDLDRLMREFIEREDGFWLQLAARSADHGADRVVARAARLCHALFKTPVPLEWQRLTFTDRLFMRRLLARDGWGRDRRPATRLGFYIRSHWMRMPPTLLAQHLWIKWRAAAG